MKKEYKVIIAIILAVWIFAMGMVLGVDKGIEDTLATANSTTLAPTDQTPSNTTTTPPTTETPTTTAPPTTTGLQASTIPSTSTNTDASTTVPTTQNSDDPSSLSKAQIIEKVNSYVAQLKAEQNMTAHKAESIKIEVVDFSIPSAISIINSIINGLAGDEEVTYTFTNGTEAGGGTPYSLIPPTNKDFLLSEAGVVSAEAKKSGTDTVYTVNLAVEETTAEAPVPQYNSTAIGYLDLTSLDLPSMVTITKANMHYPGSTVEITVNEQGKVVKLINKMPMTGEGGAKIFGAEGTASFQGGLDETWDFTY